MNPPLIPLDFLPLQTTARIVEIFGDAAELHRLREMGLAEGETVRVLRGGSPMMLDTCGRRLMLRGASTSQILVQPIEASESVLA